MKNQEYLDLMEKLFNAQLTPIKSDLCSIKKAIYGNGKMGILDRIDVVEDTQVIQVRDIKNIYGKFAIIASVFGLVFTGVFEIIMRFFGKRLGL